MKKWIFDTARADLELLDGWIRTMEAEENIFKERCAIEKLRLFIIYVEKELGVEDD